MNYRVRQTYSNIISFYNWIYLISCYNCCCRYISSLNTSILRFRSLNCIKNTISMAIDRETIVSLHKKDESNSTIAKELQIRWNDLKSGQEVQWDRADIQSTGPGQKENSYSMNLYIFNFKMILCCHKFGGPCRLKNKFVLRQSLIRSPAHGL